MSNLSPRGFWFRTRKYMRIADMIDWIKIINRKGKRGINNRDDLNFQTISNCHSCKEILDRKYVVQCSHADCERFFCFKCMKIKFDLNELQINQAATAPSWSCFSCKQICSCRICKDRHYDQTVSSTSRQPRRRRRFGIVDKVDYANQEIGESPSTMEDESSNRATTGGGGNPNKRGFSEAVLGGNSKNGIGKKTIIIDVEDFEENRVETNKAPGESMESTTSRTIGRRGSVRGAANTVEKNEKNQSGKGDRTNAISLSRGATVRRSMRNSSDCLCHFCGRAIGDFNFMKCSLLRCSKFFCSKCLAENFNTKNERKSDGINSSSGNTAQLTREAWVCHSCNNTCACQTCKPKSATNKFLQKRKLVRLLFSSIEDVPLTRCSAHPKDLKLVFDDLEFFEPEIATDDTEPIINEDAARKYLRRKKLLTEHEATLSGICQKNYHQQ
eukprot:TRINITY_DN10194_c0_g1_i1.p1 TRINITY_DN10194_c0_g1~~TRINITY_DN10194_c0_g1_i1.p1  ORF type:complete len:443 (+),score=50.89 TRINITY_DN10194_c0_g1_i1:207-1535(+)